MVKIFKKIKTFTLEKLRGETPTAQLVKMELKVGKNFNRLDGASLIAHIVG